MKFYFRLMTKSSLANCFQNSLKIFVIKHAVNNIISTANTASATNFNERHINCLFWCKYKTITRWYILFEKKEINITLLNFLIKFLF